MKSSIRRTRHPLFLQFAFLLLKDCFQAAEILSSRAFCRQSCDRRFDKQAKFENILKSEIVQRVRQFFGLATRNKAAGAAPAHDQSFQLHRPESFANRWPADA